MGRFKAAEVDRKKLEDQINVRMWGTCVEYLQNWGRPSNMKPGTLARLIVENAIREHSAATSTELPEELAGTQVIPLAGLYSITPAKRQTPAKKR
ncbi:MAG: hypothetical protein ABIQ65_20715 [Thermoanaerobaculia bacterium]